MYFRGGVQSLRAGGRARGAGLVSLRRGLFILFIFTGEFNLYARARAGRRVSFSTQGFIYFHGGVQSLRAGGRARGAGLVSLRRGLCIFAGEFNLYARVGARGAPG